METISTEVVEDKSLRDTKGRRIMDGGDAVFAHKPNRNHEHAGALLGETYKGILQSDAYPAYKNYAGKRDGVMAFGCFAHTRRKFYEASHKRSARAWTNFLAADFPRRVIWASCSLSAWVSVIL